MVGGGSILGGILGLSCRGGRRRIGRGVGRFLLGGRRFGGGWTWLYVCMVVGWRVREGKVKEILNFETWKFDSSRAGIYHIALGRSDANLLHLMFLGEPLSSR